ncbi:MAG: hypothetical protein ACLP0B_17940 [Steroidobacteraceae bacterium]|jgi:hypothetical protein
MTIFNTAYSTPLNAGGGFQGTAPGYNVPLQTSIPGPGLFPPGSISMSLDTIQAAVSSARAPANLLLTNTLAGVGAAASVGGRQNSLLERMSESGTNGTQNTIGGNSTGAFHPMCNSANGGSGPGAGGANDDLGMNSGRSDTLCGSMPAALISVSSPNPNFSG